MDTCAEASDPDNMDNIPGPYSPFHLAVHDSLNLGRTTISCNGGYKNPESSDLRRVALTWKTTGRVPLPRQAQRNEEGQGASEVL